MDQSFDTFNGQFILTQDETHIPSNWIRHSQCGWIVGTHSDLPITNLYDQHGSLVGWLIGYAVTADTFCPDQLSLAAHDTLRQSIEELITTLGGRFIITVLTDSTQAVYLDACGSMSAVYSTIKPIVASTTSLINTPDHPWDTELIDALNMPESGLWYPFGLTPRKYVQRLLPHHVLDLTTLTTQRYYPVSDITYAKGDIESALHTITTTIQQTINIVAENRPLHLTLTAGRDSRMVLACARSVLDKTIFFTFTIKRDTADAHIARKLARRFSLKHWELPKHYASPEQLELWQLKTGQSVSGEIWKMHPTTRRLDTHRVLMTGMAGEVGRGFYWRDGDTPTTKLSAADIIARCHLPFVPQFEQPAQAWLDQVPTDNLFFMLDLLYLEQRLGAWAGPQGYGSDERNLTTIQVFPLAHRRIFEAMFSLPIDYRKQQRLAIEICHAVWPELMTLPFNQFSGFWRYPRRFAKYGLQMARKTIHSIRALKNS